MNYIPLFLNCLLQIRATIDDALGYWGRRQHKPIISHILLASPEPLVLSKRNAGSGYEIGAIFVISLPIGVNILWSPG